MQDKTLFFTPHKLQSIKKQLQMRIDRRDKSRELLLPKEKDSFVAKIKSIFTS